MVGLTGGWETSDNIYNRLDIVLECDRQTDRRRIYHSYDARKNGQTGLTVLSSVQSVGVGCSTAKRWQCIRETLGIFAQKSTGVCR